MKNAWDITQFSEEFAGITTLCVDSFVQESMHVPLVYGPVFSSFKLHAMSQYPSSLYYDVTTIVCFAIFISIHDIRGLRFTLFIEDISAFL